MLFALAARRLKITAVQMAVPAIFKKSIVFTEKPGSHAQSVLKKGRTKDASKKLSLADVQHFIVKIYKSEGNMRNLFSLVFIMMITLSQAAHAAESFIEGMEDIPIPDKMMQIRADNISFGNEETRLVEAYLQANFYKFSFVAGFYEETLPQLGWTFEGEKDGVLTFVRGNEELDIAMESKLPLIVRVTLTGRPQ